MQTPETQTAEVSPLDSLSFAQYEHWRETGEMPKTETADEPQPKEGEQTGSSDANAAEEHAEAKTAEAETEPSDDSEQAKKPRGGFQRKIERLKTENEGLQRQLDELNAKLAPPPAQPKPGEAAANGAKPEQTTAPAVDENEPQPDDFETYGEYVKALTEYTAEKRQTEALKAERDRLAQATHNNRIEQWKEKLTDARTRYSDFDAKMNADVTVTPAMRDVLFDSEAGADLAYWLGSNPQEAARIAALQSPLAVARELGKVEAGLKTAAVSAPKKTTSAPPPPSSVRGQRTPATQSIYDDALASDYGAWEKARNAQLKRR